MSLRNVKYLLKGYIEKKSKLRDFLSLKTSSPGQFLELLKLKNQRSGSKTARWFPIILILKKKKKKKLKSMPFVEKR